MTIQETMRLAIERHQSGNLPEAEGLYPQVLSDEPNQADALYLLGVIVSQNGRLAEAAELMRRASELGLGRAEIHFNLANVLRRLDRLDDCISAYRKALELQPSWPLALNNLGSALQARGDLQGAVGAYRQATLLQPDFATPHRNLGRVFRQLNQFDAAIEHCRMALALEPDNENTADDYNTLGSALRGKGELDQATKAYEQALARQPDRADALNNLAEVHRETGCLRQAIDCFNRVLELHPGAAAVESSRVYALHFDPDYDAQALYREHRLWNQRHALPLRNPRQMHGNNREPQRRLKLGYISPDLRDHVVGLNLLPLLKEHDHERFEIFAYAGVASEDRTSRRLREACDAWRNIYTLSDEQAAALIREDGIDILVDLSLHMARNRLLVFARKPAPVQVTYLGYCSTTGLDAIDYRLSDWHLDPPDTDLTVYSEKTVRLGASYWCYHPGGPTPDVGPPPLAANRYVTFGLHESFFKGVATGHEPLGPGA